ncbi:MAG: hypothetical protein A2X19_01325 [Bacteroidetes bacterium GWE2_39_28]|nr:MAG: hypothetical protein A2X19_01325 [Bacteroidetes bacterium GWE2_39_28]OFY15880.1 MAG: hypothetical protein A2X16_01595 [Bacteroidetes bacterium GWF2_39_10]OFZ07652.1 MAG: hypothetical protein A2322_09220 [Bacteroidetes bacterium RIFOXYB2_FULL_39_7]OFZ10046.1 MAG: hypothetical protein A2465_06535 [Bacteroidetes bacterium RIFOXYC2_FULL_39_11]
MKVLLPIIAFSLSAAILQAQVTDDQITVKRERHFKGEALYGFMNGGSELYLEYGFKNLRAIDVVYKGEEYTVEIYKMESPEDAFGIYSIHTYGILFADTVFTYDCHTTMQLQTISGDTYYTVVFEKPSKEINYDAVNLVKHYMIEADTSAIFTIPEQLSEIVIQKSGKLKFMRGPLAVLAAVPELTDYFKNLTNYKIWSLKDEKSHISKAFFYSKNEESITRLKSLLRPSDLILQGNDWLLFEF